VTLREHPRSGEFSVWFAKQKSHAKPLLGEYYRVAGPRYTTAKEIISGTGAFIAGGRWNPPDVMNVVYVSDESETALREANEHFRYHNLPVWTGMPRVIVAVRATLGAVLDFTADEVAAALPEPMNSLLAEDWRAIMSRGNEATTQAMGRAAFGAGLEGLLVPSKPDATHVNLMVFPRCFAKSSKLEVLNADELDKLGRPS
jgi:RES domain-containing protein